MELQRKTAKKEKKRKKRKNIGDAAGFAINSINKETKTLFIILNNNSSFVDL